MDVIIITGQSGAGKTKAIDALEDRGVFCVDNVPPSLIPAFADMASKTEGISHLAVVTDARAGEMFRGLQDCLAELKKNSMTYRILFLQCSDEVLERRYRETRRRHPLQKDRRYSVRDAIVKESELLKPAYELADYHIDTTFLSPAQLKQNIDALFDGLEIQTMTLKVMSFGFKYGIPTEADLVFDVRCLPNPFYEPDLKALSGLDCEVTDWLWSHEVFGEYMSKLYAFLDFTIPLYIKEGKTQLVIACGCTGGRHRSVAIAQDICDHLTSLGYAADSSHRDMGKTQ